MTKPVQDYHREAEERMDALENEKHLGEVGKDPAGETVENLAASETLDGVAGLPWYVDGIKNDGSYGDGPDVESGFESYAIFTKDGDVVVDTLNSTLATVEVDSNDDEHFAWDRIGRANVDLIVAAVNSYAALNGWLSCGMDEAFPRRVCLTFATADDAYAYYRTLIGGQ